MLYDIYRLNAEVTEIAKLGQKGASEIRSVMRVPGLIDNYKISFPQDHCRPTGGGLERSLLTCL